jgi:hypothetical protein
LKLLSHADPLCFCAINSDDDFTSNQISIFKRNEEFTDFLIRWTLLSKVGYALVVEYDGA